MHMVGQGRSGQGRSGGEQEEGMVRVIKTDLGQDERRCVLLAQLLNINSMVYFFFFPSFFRPMFFC